MKTAVLWNLFTDIRGVFFIFYLLVKSINKFPNILRHSNKIGFMSHKSIWLKKKFTDHLQIFTEGSTLMLEEVCPKTAALCAAVLELFKILDRGRAFFVLSPVIGGLTWSDSCALAERAVLLPCKLRPLGLGDDWWSWNTFPVNTNVRYSIIFPSMYLGTKVY